MTTPTKDHGELKRAAEAATQGPWEAEPNRARGAWIKGAGDEWAALACGDTDESAANNARFIALANPATVLSILAENEALRAALEKAHRISIRHDHEITRLVDLQDHLAAALKDNTHA